MDKTQSFSVDKRSLFNDKMSEDTTAHFDVEEGESRVLLEPSAIDSDAHVEMKTLNMSPKNRQESKRRLR